MSCIGDSKPVTYLGDAANVIANSLPDASLPGSCVACVAGTFKTALGGEACSPCPADHYCPPASARRPGHVRSSSPHASASVQACLCADRLVLFSREDAYMCEECHADTFYARDITTSVGICVPMPCRHRQPRPISKRTRLRLQARLSS